MPNLKIIYLMAVSVFCKHRYRRLRVIHGDEIIGTGYSRSEWYCVKCGRCEYSHSMNSIRVNKKA